MKTFLGLSFGIAFFFIAVHLKKNHGYSDPAFMAALAFAVIGGCSIAFFDRIKSLKFAGSGVELAVQQIDEAKNKAIAEITHTVNRLKRDATDHAGRIGQLENAEPQLILDEKGYERTVMVRTDEFGRKFATYTDSDGRCREVIWNE